MTPLFLRKKQRQETATKPASQTIRHSLSLPDLTTPLLDTSSWEEVPPFAFSSLANPVPAHQSQGGRSSRNRKPSLVSSDAQFHRPFTPKQVLSGGWVAGDFRTSNARWEEVKLGGGRGPGTGMGIRQSMASRRKTRRKGAAEKMTVVVAGGKAVGKTSFSNFLFSTLAEDPSSYPTPSPRPTTCPTSQTILSNLGDRLLLRLIDTPGLELSPDDGVSAKERERGVAGLLSVVEERFEHTLREERKVRRQVGAEEQMVHLVIYLIDARDVLRPEQARKAQEIDWSCACLFDDDEVTAPAEIEAGATDMGPVLSAVEIDIIRRLDQRSNVLPVLARTDSLTIQELESVRAAVKRDLATAFAQTPGEGFGVFKVAGNDDSLLQTDSIKEEDQMDLDDNVQRPLTPDSIHSTTTTQPNLPYSIFVPSPSTLSSDPVRAYPWGNAAALDGGHSDFMLLREAILGEYPKILRNRTREVLYENYRTERLLKQAGK